MWIVGMKDDFSVQNALSNCQKENFIFLKRIKIKICFDLPLKFYQNVV